jgi:hypothetical protein
VGKQGRIKDVKNLLLVATTNVGVVCFYDIKSVGQACYLSILVRFQVLMATSTKMTAVSDIAPCSVA